MVVAVTADSQPAIAQLRQFLESSQQRLARGKHLYCVTVDIAIQLRQRQLEQS